MNTVVNNNVNILLNQGLNQHVYRLGDPEQSSGADAVDWSDHCHQSDGKHREKSLKVAFHKLIAGTVICFMFMVTVGVGGALANSLAIMTGMGSPGTVRAMPTTVLLSLPLEAAHILSLFMSLLLGVFALWLSQKRPTTRMSFGYYRAEVLSSLVSMFVIWALTAVLVYLAIVRIIRNDFEIHANPMLIISVFSVAVNVGIAVMLSNVFRCGHGFVAKKDSHAPGHSHKHMDVRAAFIHVLADLIQSIGVLIASVVIYFKPEYRIVDPICIFVFSLFVLITTADVLRDAFFILMEGVPKHIDYKSVKESLLTIADVKCVHSLHVWSLTPDRTALSVHLAIDGDAQSESVLKCAEDVLRRQFSIHETSIQVEKYNELVMNSCFVCKTF